MRKKINRKLNRRDFLKLGGGALAGAAFLQHMPRTIGQSGSIVKAAGSAQFSSEDADIHLVGTDGWIYLPGDVPIPGTNNQFYVPDDFAPAGLTAYMFGYRDVTGMTDEQIFAQKMKCQATAPMFWVDQGKDYRIKLTNPGLQMRPDLIDEHTIHWHGFRDAWPIFDGEPHSSVRVPIGNSLTYFYRPFHPGTYMYHCHVEETEHVHMGMTGSVFVRPLQDGMPYTYQGKTFTKFAYNDGDGSTGFDREYVINLTDFWAEAHWADSHVQLPDWSNFNAEYFMMNGRVYPDTLEPNGGGVWGPHVGKVDRTTKLISSSNSIHGQTFDPNAQNLPDAALIPPSDPNKNLDHLRYQPLSSLITCNEGDSVLIRLINLCFTQQSMTLPGIKLRIVGRDATPMVGSTSGVDYSYGTHTLNPGSGSTVDAIFTAPTYKNIDPNNNYDTYIFYNRNFNRLSNGGAAGYGGQMTEIRVYPANTLSAQEKPNM